MSQANGFNLNQLELIRVYRHALVEGIDLDKIERKVDRLLTRTLTSSKIENIDEQEKTRQLKRQVPMVVRVGSAFLPVLLILVGLGLVGSAILPIVAYYVNTLPSLRANKLAAPIPQEQLLDVAPLIISQDQTQDFTDYGTQVTGTSNPVIINTALDYTNLANWFDETDYPVTDLTETATEYILEIPELEIYNAQVRVSGTDLNKSLIQYPGTALPGKPGSPVIFGHSVLRQFYNPKESNPRRYNSIFSTIMTLQKNDKIYLTYDDVRYTYVVQERTEVKPTDTYILSQKYDSRQLKLVTCVPEGTYLKRGVVTAQLVKE